MKTIKCHHCRNQIVWNKTADGKGYWAHPITLFNGKAHSIENALMEQRCPDGIHWATVRRLTPRQLLELRDELAEALNSVVQSTCLPSAWSDSMTELDWLRKQLNECQSIARAAIAKATGQNNG